MQFHATPLCTLCRGGLTRSISPQPAPLMGSLRVFGMFLGWCGLVHHLGWGRLGEETFWSNAIHNTHALRCATLASRNTNRQKLILTQLHIWEPHVAAPLLRFFVSVLIFYGRCWVEVLRNGAMDQERVKHWTKITESLRFRKLFLWFSEFPKRVSEEILIRAKDAKGNIFSGILQVFLMGFREDYWGFRQKLSLGIFPGIYSEIPKQIPTGIPPESLLGIHLEYPFGISYGVPSGIAPRILPGVLPLRHISNFLSGIP